MTFGELDAQVDALAATFSQAGLEAGDVVALLSRNRPEWMVTYEAALRAGVILLPVNWHLEADDVHYVLTDSGAKALVAESHFIHQAQSAPDAISLRIAIGEPIDDFQTWEEALRSAPIPSPERPRGTQMIYTSGTTGRPKGVRHDPQPSTAAAAAGTAMVAMFGMDVYLPFTHICLLSEALVVAKVLFTGFPLGRSRISISDRPILLAIAVTNSNLLIVSAGSK